MNLRAFHLDLTWLDQNRTEQNRVFLLGCRAELAGMADFITALGGGGAMAGPAAPNHLSDDALRKAPARNLTVGEVVRSVQTTENPIFESVFVCVSARVLPE